VYEGPRGGTAQHHEMQRSERGVWSFQASFRQGLHLPHLPGWPGALCSASKVPRQALSPWHQFHLKTHRVMVAMLMQLWRRAVQTSDSWLWRYYKYRVTVYCPWTRRVETVEVTDPYSVSLAADGERTQVADLSVSQPVTLDVISLIPLGAHSCSDSSCLSQTLSRTLISLQTLILILTLILTLTLPHPGL